MAVVPDAGGPLSPQAVARGLTNPEIAARLGVTAGTIKDHVSSALRKLSVRTRAELAAAVSSHPGM